MIIMCQFYFLNISHIHLFFFSNARSGVYLLISHPDYKIAFYLMFLHLLWPPFNQLSAAVRLSFQNRDLIKSPHPETFSDFPFVLICWGCHNKIPQPEWLKRQKLIFSYKSKSEVLAVLISREASPWLVDATFSLSSPGLSPVAICVLISLYNQF